MRARTPPLTAPGTRGPKPNPGLEDGVRVQAPEPQCLGWPVPSEAGPGTLSLPALVPTTGPQGLGHWASSFLSKSHTQQEGGTGEAPDFTF